MSINQDMALRMAELSRKKAIAKMAHQEAASNYKKQLRESERIESEIADRNAEWDRLEKLNINDLIAQRDELKKNPKYFTYISPMDDSVRKQVEALEKDIEAKQLIDKRKAFYGIGDDYIRTTNASEVFDPQAFNPTKIDTSKIEEILSQNNPNVSPSSPKSETTEEDKEFNRWLIHNGDMNGYSVEEMRQAYARQQASKEWADEMPVMASLVSVSDSLVGGIMQPFEYIESIVQNRPIQKNKFAEFSSDIREEVGKDMNGIGRFFYNVGLSGLESALVAAVPGGAFLLGASAAAQTTNDLIDRGASSGQAIVGGIAAGIFEGFFEKFSISALKSMQLDEISSGWKAFLKNTSKQVVTNASEEAATEVANIAFDTIFMGDISNASMMISQLMEQGMSKSDAIKKAAGTFANQVIEAGLSGALMGAGFGAIGMGAGRIERGINERTAERQAVSELLSTDEGKQKIAKAVEYAKGEGATNKKLAKAVTAYEKEANEKTVAKLMRRTYESLSEKPISKTVSDIKTAASTANIDKDNAAIKRNTMPEIKSVKGTSIDDIMVASAEGKEVPLSNFTVDAGNTMEAYLYASTTGTVQNANNFIKAYKLYGGDMSAQTFWSGWTAGMLRGQSDMTANALEKAKKDFASFGLSDEAMSMAFLAGRNMRTSTAEKRQAIQKKYTDAWKESGGKEKKASFDDKALKGKTLDKTQEEFVAFARSFSEVFGVNVELFYSEKGNRSAENGSYSKKKNLMRLDINAGIENNQNYSAIESAFINTIAHESVHNMAEVANEQYQVLRDFVLDRLRKQGYNVEENIQVEVEKAAEEGKKISRETAIEEIVSRACEDMLGSSETIKSFMSDFYAKDANAANTLVKNIKAFLAKLADFFKRIAGQKSVTDEARIIAKSGAESVSELQKLFDEGIKAMREGNIARNSVDLSKTEVAEATNIEVDTETESAAPLNSLRTWTESDYVTARDKMAEELHNALGVSLKKAKKYIDDVNSVAKAIADDRVRLDYVASTFGSAFVSNVEYGGSFDYTTLCKKRRLFTGTFTEIQKKLKNTTLTAEDYLKIRNLMIDMGYEAPCGLCYVEGSRANTLGRFAKDFIRLYKAENPSGWIPTVADVTTPDGVEKMRIQHPECYERYEYFWNHYGKLKDSDPALFASQQKPKLYEGRYAYDGEILKNFSKDESVEKKNRNGGIRMQSFSDFEIVHMIDTMQVIMDMSMVGLAGQAYTKVPEFARAFGNTGLKINLSLIAKGVDENGALIFDDREGMPHETAFELRDQYSKNVGTIIVTFTDEQLYAAMADPRIDFIIPFHRSQWKKGQYNAMGLPKGTKDYTYMQNEKLLKQTYHEYHGRMVKDKATNYMPNEYWDFSKNGKENAENYLKLCAENNKRPKFYKLLDYDGNGKYSLKEDGSTDGYWKLLVDFKMYDNEGNGSKQMPVRPDYTMSEVETILNEYEGGHTSYPIAHEVVDAFLEQYDEDTLGSRRGLKESKNPKIGNVHFEESDENFSLRKRSPSPSEILSSYFESDPRYTKYKDQAESLKDYQKMLTRREEKSLELDDVNADIGRLKREHRQSGKGTRMYDLETKARKLETEIDELSRRMFDMETKKLKKVIDKEMRRTESNLRKAEREKYLEKSKQRTTNMVKRAYIESIQKRSLDLRDMLMKNSNDKHVPDGLKKPLKDLLLSIDFSSKRSLNGGAETKEEQRIDALMAEVADKITSSSDVDLSLYLLEDFVETWNTIRSTVNNIIKNAPGRMVLNEMSAEELKSLNRMLINLKAAISQTNELFKVAGYRNADDLADKSITRFKEYRKKHDKSGNESKIKTFFEYTNTTPWYFFSRLGKEGMAIFEGLLDGQDQLTLDLDRIENFAKTTYNEEESKQWGKEIHYFKVQGTDVYLTTAQIMSLYELNKREQARKHLLDGGAEVGKIDKPKWDNVKNAPETNEKEVNNSSEGFKLTQNDIDTILGVLTQRQKDVADKLAIFMQDVAGREWADEIHLRRHGIKLTSDGWYYPIQVSSNAKNKTDEELRKEKKSSSDLRRILHISALQSVNDNASERIMLNDIFEVFTSHTADMARYHSLALPLLDTLRWYNFNFKNEEGTTINVKTAIKDAYGEGALKYITNFITDLNNAQNAGRNSAFSNEFLGKVKAAQVGANLRTVMLQPLSIVRALNVLGMGDIASSLARTVTPKKIADAMKLAKKHCPTVLQKSKGYHTLDVARPLTERVTQRTSTINKLAEYSMKGAEFADSVTLGYLWMACERKIAKDTKLQVGSPEYYKKVGKLLRDVIYQTQVVDTVFARSELMRSKDGFAKAMSAFAAETTLGYNTMEAAVLKIQDKKRMGEKVTKGDVIKVVGKPVMVFCLGAIITAAVESLPDAVRDKDDEEFIEKYTDHLVENFITEINPLNTLPIVREFAVILDALINSIFGADIPIYSSSRMETAVIDTTVKIITKISKLFKDGATSDEIAQTLYQLLRGVSQLTGVGVSNLYREFVVLWNLAVGEIDSNLKISY